MLLLALGTGCGGGSLGPATTSVGADEEVSARRYLADAAAAATALNDFTSAVSRIPRPATPEALRAAAPSLAEPLRRAEVQAGRLAAERVADRRLEAQRTAAAQRLATATAAMRSLVDAASRGQPLRARQVSETLRAAVIDLRGIG